MTLERLTWAVAMTRNFDLNLLKVFEAMVEHRSVHGASRALWMTPEAVCDALTRLRHELGDPLFIAGESGLVPTSRAMELSPELLSGMKHIRRGLKPRHFTTGAMKRTFRLAVSDDIAFLLGSVVQKAIGASPLACFEVHHMPGIAPLRALHSGRLDVVLGRDLCADGGGVLRSARLCVEEEILVARRGHPLGGGLVSELQLAAYPRAAIARGCEGGPVGRQELSAARFPPVLVDSYTLLPALLAATDLVAAMPRSAAEVALRAGCISPIHCELPPRSSPIDMVWHVRSEGDPCMNWLLDELGRIGGSAGAHDPSEHHGSPQGEIA
uniref:LysR family transcriptional regulator n=1 Tax=Dyella soli TaxID=522319 RepID=UPI0013F4042A|nr:LysR substrate-binding domain-containing protein [Dyella soli]